MAGNLAGGGGEDRNRGARCNHSEPAANNLLLQRRVEALQNSEQNLKQRLNQTTTLLDQERRRNGTLKGA